MGRGCWRGAGGSASGATNEVGEKARGGNRQIETFVLSTRERKKEFFLAQSFNKISREGEDLMTVSFFFPSQSTRAFSTRH